MANKAVATTTETLPARTEAVDLVAGAVSVEQVSRQVARLHDCMRTQMRPGVHYGVIPGCGKPSLWQPGADLIAMMFRLRLEYTVESATQQDGIVNYVVRASVYHIPSGQLFATALGSCNSREDKYLKNTVRRGCSAWDLANTVLKMAVKRAKVSAICAATAATEIFTVDVDEDAQPEAPEAVKSTPPTTPPVREPGEEDADPAPPPGGPDPWAEWQAVSRQLTESEMEKARSRGRIQYLTPATDQAALSRAVLAAKAVLSERR